LYYYFLRIYLVLVNKDDYWTRFNCNNSTADCLILLTCGNRVYYGSAEPAPRD